MLILRHKKHNKDSSAGVDVPADGQVEKPIQHEHTQPVAHHGNEMETNANIWELEGHIPTTWELEAANAYGVKDPKPVHLPRSS